MTPESALQILKDGSQRFVNEKPASRDLKEQVKMTAQKSNPFAVILGCFDSRVPPDFFYQRTARYRILNEIGENAQRSGAESGKGNRFEIVCHRAGKIPYFMTRPRDPAAHPVFGRAKPTPHTVLVSP